MKATIISLISLAILLSGCSVFPVVNIPLNKDKGIIYGTSSASCGSVKQTCAFNRSEGNPDAPKIYREWQDENGNNMCSCK